MEERFYLQGATILVEVNKDPRRDGDGYLLVTGQDFRAANRVEVRH